MSIQFYGRTFIVVGTVEEGPSKRCARAKSLGSGFTSIKDTLVCDFNSNLGVSLWDVVWRDR